MKDPLRDAAIVLLDSISVTNADGLCMVPRKNLEALRSALLLASEGTAFCACVDGRCVDAARQNGYGCRIARGLMPPAKVETP